MVGVLSLLCLLGPLAVHAFSAADLFPIPVQSGWSTLPSVPGISNVDSVKLDNLVLGVTKISHDQNASLVDAPGNAPGGAQAWLANYPQGSYNPTAEPRGGVGLYFPGPSGHDWSDPSVSQILFSYAVYFPQGFQFVKGGKLPGPYGGTTPDDAFACSGGRQECRNTCFDLRLMWRANGNGEIYAYIPPEDSNTAAARALKGTTFDDDSSYGISVARGAFVFATGDYTAVAQRVKLNTVGQKDGELELFVNGKSVIHATGLEIRTDAQSVFRGVHFQSFFGGSDASWATPVNQQVYFSGVSGAIVAAGASPNDGKAAFPLTSGPTTTRPGTSAPASPSNTGKPGNETQSDDNDTGAANAVRLSTSLAVLVAVFGLTLL